MNGFIIIFIFNKISFFSLTGIVYWPTKGLKIGLFAVVTANKPVNFRLQPQIILLTIKIAYAS
jgi:hypothetical protein